MMRLPSAEFILVVAVVALVIFVYLTRDVGRTAESSDIHTECHAGLCTVR